MHQDILQIFNPIFRKNEKFYISRCDSLDKAAFIFWKFINFLINLNCSPWLQTEIKFSIWRAKILTSF